MGYLKRKKLEKHIETTQQDIELGRVVDCYHLGEILALLYGYAELIAKKAPKKWIARIRQVLWDHVRRTFNGLTPKL